MSTESAIETLPGWKMPAAARSSAVASPMSAAVPETSTLAYEKPCSGVTWIVMRPVPSIPFIEYPHGSKT
eukprot:365917-Chlamydomonas_euryale.AAC.9